MDRVYRSKVDWWLGLILVITFVVMVGTGIALLVNPPSDGSPTALIALGTFLMAAFVGWLPFSLRYTITSTELLVKAAIFRWRIALDRIIEVIPTHNPLSSPALSLDRLRVNYERPNGRTWWVMISPEPREQFLNDLAQAAGLEGDGDRLMRRG